MEIKNEIVYLDSVAGSHGVHQVIKGEQCHCVWGLSYKLVLINWYKIIIVIEGQGKKNITQTS